MEGGCAGRETRAGAGAGPVSLCVAYRPGLTHSAVRLYCAPDSALTAGGRQLAALATERHIKYSVWPSQKCGLLHRAYSALVSKSASANPPVPWAAAVSSASSPSSNLPAWLGLGLGLG